ncbi:MAG: hypothetical protein FD137_2066 [Spirochaetes bacterium]|nr:MAG: hypothetical protein FD137_2066 [Spirochaetota bacterium]
MSPANLFGPWKAMVRMVGISVFFFIATGMGIAQDSQDAMDLDALFGDEPVVAQESSEESKIDPVASLTKTEGVRIGGLFSGSLSSAFTWNKLWDGSSPLFNPENRALTLGLGGTLFFDARPEENFRVYGSAKTSWPFLRTDSGVSVPNLQIFELFSDFSLDDRIFFRFGKSTVKWGVGYFWSPADVINLESINIFDAETPREGPVNFRVHLPLLGSQSNFYIYTILDSSDVKFETSALAAKAELLLGSYELGLGGYYRYDTAERAMLTLTGPLGDLDIFGEAMVSRGSTKTFVDSILPTSPYTIATSDRGKNRAEYFFSASAGFLYSNRDKNLSVIAQYFFNGEGYAPALRDSLIADGKTAIANAGGPDSSLGKGLSAGLAGLLLGSGQHYAALNLSKGEVFGEDLSVSLLALANLSDLSGIVKPSLAWSVTENFSLTASPTFFFGPEEGEYSFVAGGNIVTFTLGARLTGSF